MKMNPLRKALIPLAGVAVIALVISVARPRTVHAIITAVATLVQDVDNPARHPFHGSCVAGSFSTEASCAISVPAGEEVVLQMERLYTTADPKNTKVLNTLSTVTAGSTVGTEVLARDSGFFQPYESESLSNSNWTLYADPRTMIGCNGTTKAGNTIVGLALNCDVTGYYVTLP